MAEIKVINLLSCRLIYLLFSIYYLFILIYFIYFFRPKIPGESWMFIGGKKVIFQVGTCIEKPLIKKAENQGYKIDISWALKGETETEKKESLCGHSEKRAIEYALKKTPEKSKITIFKNLRICGDCHAFTEAISRETQRVISIRDLNLFHTFDPVSGCSCKGHF